jgi:hypothetical protein
MTLTKDACSLIFFPLWRISLEFGIYRLHALIISFHIRMQSSISVYNISFFGQILELIYYGTEGVYVL